MPFNEECNFENVLLIMVKIKSGSLKIVNITFPHSRSITRLFFNHRGN